MKPLVQLVFRWCLWATCRRGRFCFTLTQQTSATMKVQKRTKVPKELIVMTNDKPNVRLKLLERNVKNPRSHGWRSSKRPKKLSEFQSNGDFSETFFFERLGDVRKGLGSASDGVCDIHLYIYQEVLYDHNVSSRDATFRKRMKRLRHTEALSCRWWNPDNHGPILGPEYYKDGMWSPGAKQIQPESK